MWTILILKIWTTLIFSREQKASTIQCSDFNVVLLKNQCNGLPFHLKRSVAIKIINNPFKFEPLYFFQQTKKGIKCRYKFQTAALFQIGKCKNWKDFFCPFFHIQKNGPYFKRNLNSKSVWESSALRAIRAKKRRVLVKCQFVLSIIVVKSLRINSYEQIQTH